MGSTRGAGLGAPSPRASGAGSGTRTSSFFIGPGLGYGYGMGYGMGYGGGGFFNLVLFAMLALAASNALRNATGRGGFGDGLSAGGDSISVVKIQVGLLGSARALQKDLERIADKADTSSPDGLHFVLSETVLALLRNPEYCVYGYAASKVCRGPEQAEETWQSAKDALTAAARKIAQHAKNRFSREGLVPTAEQIRDQMRPPDPPPDELNPPRRGFERTPAARADQTPSQARTRTSREPDGPDPETPSPRQAQYLLTRRAEPGLPLLELPAYCLARP